MASDLKYLTARSVKWNLIDRVSSIGLYTLIGIVLARELDDTAFGMVGTVLMFQAFASLFVDSGFSYALIQRRDPSREDYSSVLWFNMAMSLSIYVILWFLSPFIAEWYDRPELLWIGRITFLSFIFNAASIVQTNRLMKQKNVAPVAMANTMGLVAGGAVAIYLAVTLPMGQKVWAVVWQTNVLNFVRCVILWIYTRWTPVWSFSLSRLRGFMAVGGSMMTTSLLNTVFQNIYTFVIGTVSGMGKLGYYTQADKWSKMGIQSLTQTLTSSFLPTLSDVNDDTERFSRVSRKMNRAGAYVLIPGMGLVIALAAPLFHMMFGTKWDPAISLFCILLLRGIFTSITTVYDNYVIALGLPRMIVGMELLRDITALVAIVVCWPFINDSYGDNVMWGIQLLLWGQLAASFIAWIATLWYVAPKCNRTRRAFIGDMLPYAGATLIAMVAMWGVEQLTDTAWLQVILMSLTGLTVYIGLNALFGSNIQRELLAFLRSKR